MTKTDDKASKTTALAAPPRAPEGKPIRIGATTATATTVKGKGGKPDTTTLRLVRVLKAPPERVYQAFLDPDALAKWLPPHGFTAHVHSFDGRVGGTFRISFNTVGRTWGHTFGGRYLELKPNERIVHTDKFEGDQPGFDASVEMKVTIELRRVAEGTEVAIVQENIPAGPAADGAPYGWSQSLDNLANLVEAELPF